VGRVEGATQAPEIVTMNWIDMVAYIC